MRYLTLTVLLLFTSIGCSSATAQDGDKHPQAYLEQFQKQCMEGTNNKSMCDCAVTAFQDVVSPSEARFGHHAQVNVKVLHISIESLEILAPYIAECEDLHPM
jgi:hypothetical protein